MNKEKDRNGAVIFKRGDNGESPRGEEMDYLEEKAQEIKGKFKGNPEVVIVVAGEGRDENDHEPRSCLMGNTFTKETYRFRHVAGILQTAIQIESVRHFVPQVVKQVLKKMQGEDEGVHGRQD